MGGRRVLPRGRRRGRRGPAGRRGQARGGPALDRDHLVARRAARVGSRPRGAPRAPHARAAGRALPLGVRRPALLGRRGRLVHQRVHARRGRVARRRRDGAAPHRPRRTAARRRVELRVGRGRDRVVVPLDAQRAQGPPRLPGARRGHGRAARRAPRRRGVPAPPRPVPPARHRRARRGLGVPPRLPVPLVLQRAQRAGLPARRVAARRHARGARTAPGSRAGATRAACGSRSTRPRANRHAGSRTTRPSSSTGGTVRTRAAPRRPRHRRAPR